MPNMSHPRPSKRRRIAVPPSNGAQLFTTAQSSSRKHRKRDEVEYERVSRTAPSADSHRLLRKTEEKWFSPEADNRDELKSLLDSEKSDEDDEVDAVTGEESEKPEEREIQISHNEQIIQAQEELARLAALINEDPEEHTRAFRALGEVAQSSNVTVKQLAIATQCAVYKDVIPGYRIRPVLEEHVQEKVSKDVKKMRNYEQSLVNGYQAYVRELSKVSRARPSAGKEAAGLASTALACAATLLLTVPHFNFRTEVMKIVVEPLGRRVIGRDYEKSLRTLEKLFQEDDDGRPSLEAVSMLTKMMKVRDYQIDESVLNVFLHLRLLSEFSSKASYDSVDRQEPQLPKKVKQLKEKREFRTKRQRKQMKEQKVLAKEMDTANAVVSHEERDKLQAEMLKLVFATYFRILKAKTEHLMGAVLEGLAKYAHLINQDFFADILEALKDLIRATMETHQEEDHEENGEQKPSIEEETVRDATRESLLCVITAFALLQGQDGKAAVTNLHLDLSFFITHLYRTLIPAIIDADIELGSKSMHLPDPLLNEPNRVPTDVNVKTKTVLLIRCLSSVILPKIALRSVPPLRLAAFTKQLMTVSLQLPEKSCQAMLGLLAQTSKVHGKKIAALWHTEERRGDGVFDALRGDVEGSNPFASTIWEGELLRNHFSPRVREALKIVEGNIRAES